MSRCSACLVLSIPRLGLPDLADDATRTTSEFRVSFREVAKVVVIPLPFGDEQSLGIPQLLSTAQEL
jgi:hypothetical protein